MSQIEKLDEKARRGSALRFGELEQLLRAYGFGLQRVRGSHQVYRHPAGVIMNVQPSGKAAKIEQVKELIRLVDRHGLAIKDA